MPAYLHPGVYIEEIPSGLKPIGGVATSVAAFIGFTAKGPMREPSRIGKWDDYANEFGGIQNTGADEKGDPMGHTVAAFFQNGGANAYIVRIAQEAGKAEGFMDHPIPDNTTQTLKFSAINEGAWANNMVVQLNPMATDTSLYTLKIGRRDKKGAFAAQETFSNLSLVTDDPLYIENVVNGASELLDVDLVDREANSATISGSANIEYYLGTSTSDALDDASLDLSGIVDATDMELEISLNGAKPSVKVTVPMNNYHSTDGTTPLGPAALATEIENQVRGNSTSIRRKSFTCTYDVDANKLVLTSGTRTDISSVVVSNTPMAKTLKLGTANGGVEATTQQTKADAFAQPWDEADALIFRQTTLAGGSDGLPPKLTDYQSVFAKLVKYRDITMLGLPDQAWDDAGKPALSAAIAHAEQMKNRLVFIDPPAKTELESAVDVAALSLPTSTYTVLYYPWARVANPYFDGERNPGAPRTVLVPASGFAAGMWSKIDGRRGVWKAPAGVGTSLLGLASLEYRITDGDQDQLNPLGINCLRSLPNYGAVIWGARTLATNADPEWRYVPVRRTAIMIEQSTFNGLQWAVFEPNDHRLWSALRLNIESFMDGLFRAGAFQGEKASDAYFVRCGLGDSMTQGDIDRGQVIVVIGFAPLKPAEFVIVRIQQKLGKQ